MNKQAGTIYVICPLVMGAVKKKGALGWEFQFAIGRR